ncbi:MAG: potassium transporter [Beggiatoa sp. IS2]|nr:MAG: potassium transporter [Beggiatoa sp. IS2]
MQFKVIQRILGVLLILFSLTLLPSMGISVWYDDGNLYAFIVAFMVMASIGVGFWLPVKDVKKELSLHDGFVVTAMFWIVLSLVSAVPFLIVTHLSLAQAVFEAVSGFTTTGATVITGLDKLPPSFLYYRQQLHWFGGLGIIVFAIAVVPMLGIGGMQLYRAESSGPMHDDKLTPRLKHTAISLLYVYLALTASCALAYWWAGMSLFDAIGHSYSTLSTGGFSTHDDSLAYFNSVAIDVITIFFMILGSLNFAVHFMVWRKMDLTRYWTDIQGRVFVFIVIALTAIVVPVLLWRGVYTDFWTALRYALFQIVSIMSTTGYLTADFSKWPSFVPILIFSSCFIGGCVGSTAGGFRVIRVILLYKQALRGIMRLIHPSAVITVKIGYKRVSNDVAEAVWEFTVLYITSYVVLSILFMATDVDVVTAFSGVATCFNMTGPGLGEVTMNFTSISDTGLWILSFAMLLGRLEIFTLIVLLTPAFWRR